MIITYYNIFYRIYDTMLYVDIFNRFLAEVNEIQRHGAKYEGGFIYMEQENTPPHIPPPPSKNAATSVSNRVSEGISKATKFDYLLFYSFKHTKTHHKM